MRIPLVLLLATACAGRDSGQDPEDGFIVDEGKADDFLSDTAREFVVEGRSTVTVESGMGLERAQQLVSLKHTSIAWFLNQYLVDKEHDETNHDYGGFSGMVKTGSYEDLAITDLGNGTWEFKFTQLIAAKDNLLQRLPVSNGRFSIEIGRPTNEELAEPEWYRNAPWSSWNPATVPAEQKETLELSIREERTSSDAWWDYDRLFADGELTVDVHFGWDYHADYHLKHSRAFYSWLRGRGFSSPVGSFDAYKRTSGPLTKTIKADGRNVRVKIRIFYGKPGTDTDPSTDAGGRVLEDDVRASLADRDVIVYSGHSGPFYGFAMANWRMTAEGDFDDSEMLNAQMPADRYQIVMAEGCDTYMIGQAFKDNVHKQGLNVDVITTTSFSDASTPLAVQDFVARLIELDTASRHRPRTLMALLVDLDENSWGTLYGVHGIDDDPKVHPYARLDNLCLPCTANTACGGVGNMCIGMGTSGRRCTAACTDDSGCGDGYRCKAVASSSTNTIYAKACAPVDNMCQ